MESAVRHRNSTQKMYLRTSVIHGEIDDDVYIRSLEGLKLCESGQVLKFRRGLYEMKRAPGCCFTSGSMPWALRGSIICWLIIVVLAKAICRCLFMSMSLS